MDLTFDALYKEPSSLAALAGAYIDESGTPVFIGADGSIQQSILICQTSGHISIVDPAYNMYRVQLTTRCENGSLTSGSGLAIYDKSASPPHLLLGLSGGGTAGVSTWIRE